MKLSSGLSSCSSHIERVQCKTALHKLKRKFPYGWDLNIYRGCIHACQYCYAIYSHGYTLGGGFDCIVAKENIAEMLDRELSSPSWKREVVNIGGVTDSYQDAETKLQIMPDVLRVLIKHKTPAIISTKSDLILRDYDLIAELAEITYVNIASTITTMDESVRVKLEPQASPSDERFQMLKQFRETNASVGLHTMPIIPFLTDSYENIKQLCVEAKNANVHYMLPGVLYLRGATRSVFFDFIKREYPEKFDLLQQLYKKGSADRNYKDRLYGGVVNPLRSKYGISSNYSKPMRDKMHTV